MWQKSVLKFKCTKKKVVTANFVLKHEPDCELKGTKKVKGHRGYPNGPRGIWSKKYQENHQQDRKLTNVKTIKDNEAWVGHADKDGKETVPNWACVDRCPWKARFSI